MIVPSVELSRARDLLRRFADLSLLVVGDVMLDRFIVGRVTRISPEAPVPVVQFQSEHTRLGGAANVAHNIATLGAHAVLVGVIGDDRTATQLKDQLAASRIDAHGLIVDRSRPTTEKVRIVTERNQQVARVDYEQDTDVDSLVEQQIVERIERGGKRVNGVLVSDYLKGSITRRIVETAVDAAKDRVPVVVDPKIPHIHCYAGATLVTPNHHEAETATHLRIRNDSEAREAARAFRAQARCAGVLITRGEQGMWLSSDAAEGAIPAAAREVADVTGAGDTVVAVLTLALAAGASMAESAVLANQAAGLVVGKFGPATLSPDELLANFAGA